MAIEDALGELKTGEDVVGIVLGLPYHEDDAGALQLVVIERRERVANVDTLPSLRCIHLERIFEEGGETELLSQLNAKHAVLQHVGMEAERAVAIEDVLDVGLLRNVVGNAFYGHHLLPSLLKHESLAFEHWGIDFYHVVLRQSEQGGVLRAYGLSVHGSYLEFRVESGEEVGHEVLEAVEDTQRDHHRHCCHGHAEHGDAADDVDGMVALLGKEVATGYEEFEIHNSGG